MKIFKLDHTSNTTSDAMHKTPKTVQFIAVIEASKGLLVILVGLGVLGLIHDNFQTLAEQLVAHFHLNPASTYPRIFIHFAAQLTDARLALFSLFAFAYALVRFIEAYGLWFGRRWAEWFAVLSSSIYIPFEVYEGFHGSAWVSLVMLLVNVLVIAFMLNALFNEQNSTNTQTS